MMLTRSIIVASLAGTAIAVSAPLALAQTIATTVATGAVALKSFTPVDSLFVNPTATQFTITLKNSVSGGPTEYRVSRFSDFRDATWRPYVPQPTLAVPLSWFPTSVNGESQIQLYLQVRAKNPLGGRPASLINGKMTTQPDFFFSDPLARRIRIIYAG